MQKIILMATLAGAVLGLGGCNSTQSRRDIFDAIDGQLANALGKPAPVAQDDAVSNALMPPLSQFAMPKARQALDERFDVNFNDVPVRQFLNSIVAGTRYNMLVHPDVNGNISANLKDVTVFEALDAVRDMYGYDYKVEGARIFIKPLTMQTRMFQVNYLKASRRGSSSLRVTSSSVTSVVNSGNTQDGSGGNNVNSGNNPTNSNPGNNPNNANNANNADGNSQPRDSSNVSTSSNSDFWQELKTALEAIIGNAKDGRSVIVSPQSGVIVIRALPDDLRNVDLYLKATQLSVERQVILEAKILEVELNGSFQSGINWASFASFRGSHDNRVSTGFVAPGTTLAPLPFLGGQPPTLSSTGAAGIVASTGFALGANAAAAGSLFGLAFQTSNFAALISFLESQGTVHVLSSPRIATLNNQKAVLKIGTDEFFVTGVSTTTNTNATGVGSTSPSVTLQPFFSGVVLDVTPQIDDRGNIILHVHPSVSQVTTVNKSVDLGSAGNLNLPLASSSTSEIDSMVRGQDGRVVAIGGLMRQSGTSNTSQVPGAGSFPVLGALFRNTGDVTQKRELVVLIKPTIVEGANDWSQDLLDTKGRFENLDPRRRQSERK